LSTFPPIFIIVDEISEALSGYKSDFKWKSKTFPSYPKQLAGLLTSAAKLYRSSNIFIFCGAQRLDADAAPTQLRDNLKIRCAFKTGSAETSKMILIYAHAFKLPAIPGRMMLWDMESGQSHKVQVPFIEKEEAAGLLAMHSRNREETKVFMNILKALAEVRRKDAEKKKKREIKQKS
jgi:DNA segregation ATPase FtsK/SpoIIIE-like protein